MRKFLMLVALVLYAAVAAVPARAQDESKVQVFGGYSYFRYNPQDVDVNLNGWNASAEYQIFRGFGIAGDFAGDYDSPNGVNGSVTTYMFGPQFSFPSRISPFAHILFGGAHLNVSGSTNDSFAAGFGGGIDAFITHNVGIRLIQIDDVYTRFNSTSQNSPRISVGVTLRF
jgi:hypothetical protein